jgi:ribosomal protein L36
MNAICANLREIGRVSWVLKSIRPKEAASNSQRLHACQIIKQHGKVFVFPQTEISSQPNGKLDAHAQSKSGQIFAIDFYTRDNPASLLGENKFACPSGVRH